MRYKRSLSKEQMAILLKNGNLSNQELADKIGTSRQIIATYRSRARKTGIDIPFSTPVYKKIEDEFRELSKK